MPAVELARVTKSFGTHRAVDELSLTVPKGTIYGFIGPNGSGKTTTLRMLMGILHPDAGSIRILGESLNPSVTDRVGYLPEERGLYKKMKLRELLLFYGDLKEGTDVPAQVDRWLARLDLADWADKKVEALSKGMAQKAQFIATVVSRPELVILDEPFTGLDPVNTDILKEAVLELNREGATILFSTHDMAVAEGMCDFICMIFRGRKVLDGTLAEIQDRHGNHLLRVEAAGGPETAADLPGVERVDHRGRNLEIRLAREADPQRVAAALLERTEVRSFTVARPSLHDIFVAIARPEGEEIGNE